MFTWFGNLKIRSKLISAFLLIIGMTIVVGVIAVVSQYNAQNTVNTLLNVNGRAAELALQSNNAMLLARRNEKDYQLRYKELGFEKAKADYATVAQSQVITIHTNLAELKKLVAHAEDVAPINDADQNISEYAAAFLAVVTLYEQRGYLDTGLEGKFREKVHEIEAAVTTQNLNTLTIDMLTMRRHEKDYLLRSDAQYVTDLHKTVSQFKTDVAAANLAQTDQAHLTTLADEYQALFDQLVEVDGKIAAGIETYRAAVHKVEPVLEQIYAEAKNDQDKARQEMERTAQTAMTTVIGVILAAVVLGLLVAFSLSRSLANAVNRVARAAAGIAIGDLEQSVTVTSKDELGAMAAAFQRMIAYMQQMAGAATRLAVGDVSAEVTPQSDKDVLGHAFRQMVVYQQQMAQAATRLAEGDLVTAVSPKADKDVLGHAFSRMMANLRQLIGQVQQGAEQVAEASQQLNTSSTQAGQAANQVANTIQQIANGTIQQSQAVTEATGNVEQTARAAEGIAQGSQDQARSVQKTSALAGDMAGLVEQVGQIAAAVTNANGKVTQSARHGASSVEQTGQGMATIRERTTEAAAKVKDLSSRSKEIGRIIQTIDDIADKTDMLALNAAVEAARAGEHGRGFAVVADQVRKLSEDSKNSTRDIADLIERVQETITETIAAIQAAAAEVNTGSRLAGDTSQSLLAILQAAEEANSLAGQIDQAVKQLRQKSEGVVTAIESVSAVVEENTAAAEEMAANSQEVTSAMENIAGIAEENSASTEEVSASAEEMSAQIEEVVASAEELSALAEELRHAAAQFRLS